MYTYLRSTSFEKCSHLKIHNQPPHCQMNLYKRIVAMYCPHTKASLILQISKKLRRIEVKHTHIHTHTYYGVIELDRYS